METTISLRTASSVAELHNKRDEKVTKYEKHIDPKGIHEIWKDENIKDVYEELFSESVEEYNAKQKREERKITDYYKDVCDDTRGRRNLETVKEIERRKKSGKSIEGMKAKGKHPAYEIVVGMGSSEYDRDGKGKIQYSEYGKLQSKLIDTELGKKIMKEYIDGWQERNPKLKLYGVYYHNDEKGIPHIHCDFVPHADGYKQGMSKQSSIGKALEQQGFGVSEEMIKEHKAYKKNHPEEHVAKLNNYTLWQESERKVLEEICKKYGFTKINTPTKDKKEYVPHLINEEQRALKNLKDEKSDLLYDIEENHEYNEKLKDDNKSLQENIQKDKEYHDNLTDVIDYKTEELKNLENRQKVLHINQDIHQIATTIYKESKESQNTDMIEFMKLRKNNKTGKTIYEEFEERQQQKIQKAVEIKVEPLLSEAQKLQIQKQIDDRFKKPVDDFELE